MGLVKEILRRLRLTYTVYNFFSRKRLKHNLPFYKKYGLRKKYFSSVSYKDFQYIKAPDVIPNLGLLRSTHTYGELSEELKKGVSTFEDNGYVILRDFFDRETIAMVNRDTQQKLDKGELKFRYGDRKVMFSHKKIEAVGRLANNPRLIDVVKGILGGGVTLFQSISFPRLGSEQRAHTDNIHLSTFPKGGMVGVWIALEKITEQNGPITFYPKSHKLPYVTNASYKNEGSFFLIGDKPYSKYEDLMERQLEDSDFQQLTFLANPGDVLIWHANLIHGGLSHTDRNITRRSVVLHYFKNECIWFHELSQRPTIL